jgi:hypothetical protein
MWSFYFYGEIKMSIFLVCLLVFAAFFLGSVAGLRAATWARDFTPIVSAHEFCEKRFEMMNRKLRAEIAVKEAEIQDLIHRGIA